MAAPPQEIPGGLTCASIVDAMGRLYSHRAHLDGLVTPTPGRVLFGTAATIAYLPFRADLFEADRHAFAPLFYRAVGEAPAGKVLVLSSGGYPDVSHGGGTKLYRAETTRLAGILADGRLRDFAELRRCEFVTYCRGEATRAGTDTVVPFEADVPVEVGGVTIGPGDYVYVDSSGGVVIPAAGLANVLKEAREVEAADSQAREHILTERPDDADLGAGEV